jgi:radical SAM protein with 4Fe4S-binding SPASM domain
MSLQIELTRKCNLNCKHCRVTNTEHSLTKTQIKQILKKFKNYDVSINGGEVSTYKHIDWFIKYCIKHNINLQSVTSNGILLTDYKTLKPSFNISLESLLIRKNTSLVEKNIIELKKNYNVCILSTIINNDIDFINYISNIAESLLIPIIFTAVLPAGKAKDFDKVDIQKFYETILDNCKRKKINVRTNVFSYYNGILSFNDPYNDDTVFIDALGRVAPRMYMYDYFIDDNNFKFKRIEQIKNLDSYLKEYNLLLATHKKCSQCQYSTVCNGKYYIPDDKKSMFVSDEFCDFFGSGMYQEYKNLV